MPQISDVIANENTRYKRNELECKFNTNNSLATDDFMDVHVSNFEEIFRVMTQDTFVHVIVFSRFVNFADHRIMIE